jgi:hypothetical protein
MTSPDWLTLDGGGEGAATDWGHRWRYDPRDRTPWAPSSTDMRPVADAIPPAVPTRSMRVRDGIA